MKQSEPPPQMFTLPQAAGMEVLSTITCPVVTSRSQMLVGSPGGSTPVVTLFVQAPAWVGNAVAIRNNTIRTKKTLPMRFLGVPRDCNSSEAGVDMGVSLS